MSDVLSLRIEGVKGKTFTILLPKSSTVDDLYSKALERLGQEVGGVLRSGDLRLYRLDRELEYGKGKKLDDYELKEKDVLVVCVRFRGGILPKLEKGPSVESLKPLPGHVTVTVDPKEPCMLSLDDSENEPRAKMPCGHVISPASMTSYCKSLLDQGMYTFQCPDTKCDLIWEYFLVRHVACLADDERSQFEKKITENYITRGRGMQQCPGCTSWCFRANHSDVRIRCIFCAKDFCWACRRTWVSDGLVVGCGNSDCDGRDPRFRVLEGCPKKRIDNVEGCPSIRACPKCGLLIDHKEGCRHMTCTSCNTKFCFICLEVQECGLRVKCPIAPVQTRLPGEEAQSDCRRCVTEFLSTFPTRLDATCAVSKV